MNRTLPAFPSIKRLYSILLVSFFPVLITAMTGDMVMGCAAIASNLPTVLADVQDAGIIISSIEAFMQIFFSIHPDAAKQQEVANAIQTARTALNVVLRTAQGVDGLDNKNLDQAFQDFESAYTSLLQLVAPYGVHPGNTPSMKAFPGAQPQLVVPPPTLVIHAHKKGN